MTTDRAPSDGLESRLARLERIVAALETDEIELDRALELFEEGVGHVRHAEKLLAEAELKIEELVGEGSEVSLVPIPDPESE